MQTLEQAIRAKVEKDIQRLNEAEQRAKAEAARIKEAEAMASEDALILIQREAGFTLDGWTCQATHSSKSELEEYFTLTLTYPSEYRNWLHRINYDNARQVSYLVVAHSGKAQILFKGLTAFHVLNEHGQSQSKCFDDLLSAVIFARFGDVAPEAILEALERGDEECKN